MAWEAARCEHCGALNLSHGFLTPGEVARRMGVSRRTIWTWTKAGALTSVALPGSHARYRIEDVEALQRDSITKEE